MDLQRAKAKLQELGAKRNKQAQFVQHLQRQEAILERISRLLRVPPDEARECMELMVEYLQSEGILKKRMVKLPRKRIQADLSNEVKMFLSQNGLCD